MLRGARVWTRVLLRRWADKRHGVVFGRAGRTFTPADSIAVDDDE